MVYFYTSPWQNFVIFALLAFALQAFLFSSSFENHTRLLEKVVHMYESKRVWVCAGHPLYKLKTVIPMGC